MIQYFHLKDLSPTNNRADNNWVAEFERGHTSCQDEHRSGRPNEVTTTEMVNKFHKIVLDDRRLKVRELTVMIGISKSAVYRILTRNLDI